MPKDCILKRRYNGEKRINTQVSQKKEHFIVCYPMLHRTNKMGHGRDNLHFLTTRWGGDFSSYVCRR